MKTSLTIEGDYFEDKDLEEEKTYFYAITAFDEVPNESEHTEMLSAFTELGPQAPEMNNTLLDFSIKEDCYNDLINLYLWFKDRNGDKLDFEVSGENSIDVHIYQDNGTVILRPDKNWNGQEELTFYADDGEFEFWDDVVITVTAVNDAPGPAKIISPKEGFETNDTTPIIFEGSCDLDPDLVYGDELTLSWSSNISGELGTGPTLKNIVLDGGMHEITLTVTDSENARCTQTRIIFVASTKGTQIVDDNTTDDDLDLIKPVKIDDDPFAFLGNLMILMGIIAGVIVAVIVIIVFLVMRKKRPEDTTAYGGEPTTYGGETEAGSWETPLAPAYTPEPVARSPEPEQVPIPVLSEEMRRGLSDGTVQYTKPVPADSTAPRLEDILAQMGGNELS